MHITSRNTWDSIEVDGVETVFYFGEPLMVNTKKEIYLPLKESYENMGYKTLSAFEWAVNNKEFDFIARVNSSTYVDKKELIKYIQNLPNENVFAGIKVDRNEDNEVWCWGPSFILSKDVVSNLVGNKNKLDRSLMEDVGISHLFNKFNIPYINGRMAVIDRAVNGYRCMCYGGESFEFEDWQDIKKAENQFFFRVKMDLRRDLDEFIMCKLFEFLN